MMLRQLQDSWTGGGINGCEITVCAPLSPQLTPEQHMITGASDGTLCLWKVGVEHSILPLGFLVSPGKLPAIAQVVFLSPGFVFLSTVQGQIQLWLLPPLRHVYALAWEQQLERPLTKCRRGLYRETGPMTSMMISGDERGWIQVWNFESLFRDIQILDEHKSVDDAQAFTSLMETKTSRSCLEQAWASTSDGSMIHDLQVGTHELVGFLISLRIDWNGLNMLY